MSLYKKLLEIQQHVSGLGKDKKSFGYDYVSGNKVLNVIKPLMDKKGLLLKQEILSIENVRQDYQVWDKFKKEYKDKNEILSKVMMKFTWIDTETGDMDENLFGANGQNDWEKGLGSALTYAERYFLLKYFHIATDEDDIDNPERKPEEEPKPIAAKAPKKAEKEVKQWMTEDQFNKAKALDQKTLFSILHKYDGSGKFCMINDYREELEELLIDLKAK